MPQSILSSMVCSSTVIATGIAIGQPAEAHEVNSVGSAVTNTDHSRHWNHNENILQYPNADASIVGTSIKKDGIWSNPIDPDRTRALVRAFRDLTK